MNRIFIILFFFMGNAFGSTLANKEFRYDYNCAMNGFKSHYLNSNSTADTFAAYCFGNSYAIGRNDEKAFAAAKRNFEKGDTAPLSINNKEACSTSTPFTMKFIRQKYNNVLKITALEKKLAVMSMRINDGNCNADSAYQCDYSGALCVPTSKNFVPFTLKYGDSADVLTSCTPYKVVLVTKNCGYTLYMKH